ncbi:MAG: RES family NAD+ phosphorylase [Chryseobacterium culicis]
MNCCINCFESSYINGIILNNKSIGNCNYCKSENVSIYEASELSIFFKGIIDLYEVVDSNGKPIEEQIVSDFSNKVFSKKLIDSSCIRDLMNDIVRDDIDYYNKIFNNPVRLKYHSSDVEDVIIRPLSISWDNFSNEIKTVNRFHFVNTLDLVKLKSLFANFAKDIPKGKKFNRARVSNNRAGYLPKEMGNPPSHLAKSGRANPNGISYLYLGNDIATTLFEARASLFDYVSVGTFRLEENLRVVNLSRSTYDVFRLAELESLEDVTMHRSFIDKLEYELSTPRRKSDSELDYLPTQYLSELIKSMGYDGIEFKSSLYSEGYNLAIFYPDKFKCLHVDVYDIDKIELKYTKLTS